VIWNGIAFCNIPHYHHLMVTVTVKLPPALAAQVAAEARHKRVSKSAIIRESLEKRFSNGNGRRHPTVGDLTRHLMGKLKGGPHDLSTNKKHMEGFGAS
jgi:hypothetical protein